MRIVHNGEEVLIVLDDPDTHIATALEVFEGTTDECQSEIERLGLRPLHP